MATVTWSVASMSCVQQPDPNYVVQVSWVVTASESGQSFFQMGNTQLPASQQGTFIPYDQLTPEIVLGWVKTQLGPDVVAKCEQTVLNQLNYQLNPPPTPQPQPLPW